METGNTKKPRITTLDDLFGIPPTPDAGGAQIQQIELRKLHEFEGHPFKVLEDQALLDMVKSIQEIGQLTPAIARPLEDRPANMNWSPATAGTGPACWRALPICG